MLWDTWKVLEKKQEEMLSVPVFFCLGMCGSWVGEHQSKRGGEHPRTCKEEPAEETARGWRGHLDALLRLRAWGFQGVGPLNLRASIVPSGVCTFTNRSELFAQSREFPSHSSSVQSAFRPSPKSILSKSYVK